MNFFSLKNILHILKIVMNKFVKKYLNKIFHRKLERKYGNNIALV